MWFSFLLFYFFFVWCFFFQEFGRKYHIFYSLLETGYCSIGSLLMTDVIFIYNGENVLQRRVQMPCLINPCNTSEGRRGAGVGAAFSFTDKPWAKGRKKGGGGGSTSRSVKILLQQDVFKYEGLCFKMRRKIHHNENFELIGNLNDL